MHSLWPFPCQLRQQPPPGSPLLPMPAGPPPAAAASLPFAAHPHPRFCFSPPLQTTMTPASSFPRKRARPLADIEGVDEDLRVCSKKRRLRLTLVTSRLSDPYSVPSTNIMDRGNCSRVAIWAKTRMVARNVLRKAAILNKIKRDAMAAREAQERQVEIARQQFRERLAVVAAQPAPRRSRNVQFHPPLKPNCSYQLRPRKAKSVVRYGFAPVEEQSKRGYYTPKSRRPPSPPSEHELEEQRRKMELDN